MKKWYKAVFAAAVISAAGLSLPGSALASNYEASSEAGGVQAPNIVVLPAERDVQDPALYPLNGMREQLFFSENRINQEIPGLWSYMDEGVDKWDFYNRYPLYAPGDNAGAWALVYMLSGDEPTGFEKRIMSPYRAEVMEQTADVIRSFLNSFDWKNATDREKVSRILELVCQASYDYDTEAGITDLNWFTQNAVIENGGYVVNDGLLPSDNPSVRSHNLAGCLIDKLCVCEGYAKTVAVLCRFTGVEAFYAFGGNHAWDFVKVDGTWYTVDATGKTASTAEAIWFSKPADQWPYSQAAGDYIAYNIEDYFNMRFGYEPAVQEKIWNLIHE